VIFFKSQKPKKKNQNKLSSIITNKKNIKKINLKQNPTIKIKEI
jgi:hypothetical protein